MIRPDEEQQLRDRVRKSLENIMETGSSGEAISPEDVSRRQAILDEETEKYYDKMGLVKHTSRTGRTFWVTPAEKEKLDNRRRLRKRRPRTLQRINITTAAIWIGTALFAALLVAYLFATEVIG